MDNKMKGKNMKWLFKEKDCMESDISRIEKKFDVILPSDYVELVLKNNGAYPEFKIYDTETNKENMAQVLLSCCDEPMNVDEVTSLINIKGVVAFFADPFGNYLCFQYSLDNNYQIVLWNHENRTLEVISDNFSNFLNKLY